MAAPVYSGGSKTQASQINTVDARITSEKAFLMNLISTEASTRSAADTALGGRIDSTEESIITLQAQLALKLAKADFNTKLAVVSQFITDFFGEYNLVKDGTALAPASYDTSSVS